MSAFPLENPVVKICCEVELGFKVLGLEELSSLSLGLSLSLPLSVSLILFYFHGLAFTWSLTPWLSFCLFFFYLLSHYPCLT